MLSFPVFEQRCPCSAASLATPWPSKVSTRNKSPANSMLAAMPIFLTWSVLVPAPIHPYPNTPLPLHAIALTQPCPIPIPALHPRLLLCTPSLYMTSSGLVSTLCPSITRMRTVNRPSPLSRALVDRQSNYGGEGLEVHARSQTLCLAGVVCVAHDPPSTWWPHDLPSTCRLDFLYPKLFVQLFLGLTQWKGFWFSTKLLFLN